MRKCLLILGLLASGACRSAYFDTFRGDKLVRLRVLARDERGRIVRAQDADGVEHLYRADGSEVAR